MTYDEVAERQVSYDDRENAWLDNLWTAASSFKARLLSRLEIPDTYVDHNDGAQPYVRLLQAKVAISDAEPLSRKHGLEVDGNGNMPFAVELRLRVRWGMRPIYIFLGARIVNGNHQYAAWHLPGNFPSTNPTWMSLDEILMRVDGELQRYVDHDPSTGSRKDCFIFG